MSDRDTIIASFTYDITPTGMPRPEWEAQAAEDVSRCMDVVEVLPGYGALPGPGYEEVHE